MRSENPETDGTDSSSDYEGWPTTHTRFVFNVFSVMTLLYASYRHDVMFHVEH